MKKNFKEYLLLIRDILFGFVDLICQIKEPFDRIFNLVKKFVKWYLIITFFSTMCGVLILLILTTASFGYSEYKIIDKNKITTYTIKERKEIELRTLKEEPNKELIEKTISYNSLNEPVDLYIYRDYIREIVEEIPLKNTEDLSPLNLSDIRQIDKEIKSFELVTENKYGFEEIFTLNEEEFNNYEINGTYTKKRNIFDLIMDITNEIFAKIFRNK